MAEPKYTYGELRTAAKDALRQGNVQLAEHIAKKIQSRDYKEVQSDIVSGLLGASQGATLGFGEEIGAGIRAATEPFLDPFVAGVSEMISPDFYTEEAGGDLNPFERFAYAHGRREEQIYPEFADDKPASEQLRSYFGDFMKRYRTALGSARKQLETARREDPYAYLGGELGAGLAQAGAGTARSIGATGARTLGEGLRTGMRTGAKYGAAGGYGYGEADPIEALLSEDREVLPAAAEAAGEVAIGTGTGALSGILFPSLGAAGRKVAQFLTRSGTQTARLNEAGRREIAENLMADLEMRNITPEQAMREIQNTPGMTVGDLGPNLQRMVEDIAQTGTRTGEIVRNDLRARVVDQYDRIVPSMSRALGLGGKPAMFQHHTDQLLNSARTAAEPLYEAAYAKGIRVTPEMARILRDTGVGKIGRKRATEYAAEALEDIGSPLKRKDLDPGVILPTKHVDYMLRAMDDHVDKLYRGKGKRGLAVEAERRRDAFREAAYAANSAFRDARSAYAGPMKSKRALDAGKNIFKDDPEMVATDLARLTEGERLYYRVGVLKAVEQRLARKMDYQDIVNDLKARRSTRDALRVAFGSDENFDEFMGLLGREARMQETVQRAIGNSDTTRRLAQAAGPDPKEKLAQLAGYGVSLSMGGWVPPSIGGYLAGKGFRAFDPKTRFDPAYKQLIANQADILTGSDLSRAMTAQTMGGLLETGVPMASGFPAGVAAGTGILNPDVEYGGP